MRLEKLTCKGAGMSNMKRWLFEVGLTHRDIATLLRQSPSSVTQKVNKNTNWQHRDCVILHEKYGLSSDFIQDLEPYEKFFPHGAMTLRGE